MPLNSQVTSFVSLALLVTFANGQESAYFLFKDPLGVMVNYTGGIELGNIPHGFGVGIFLDENPSYTYTGEWRHGLATGFGKIQYANGDTYTGNFIAYKAYVKVWARAFDAVGAYKGQ